MKSRIAMRGYSAGAAAFIICPGHLPLTLPLLLTLTAGTAVNGLGCTALRQPLFRLLAQGGPVSVAALAGAVGQPTSEVAQAIEQKMNVEYDEAGNIVAAALSLRPTPHKVEVNGRTLAGPTPRGHHYPGGGSIYLRATTPATMWLT